MSFNPAVENFKPSTVTDVTLVFLDMCHQSNIGFPSQPHHFGTIAPLLLVAVIQNHSELIVAPHHHLFCSLDPPGSYFCAISLPHYPVNLNRSLEICTGRMKSRDIRVNLAEENDELFTSVDVYVSVISSSPSLIKRWRCLGIALGMQSTNFEMMY